MDTKSITIDPQLFAINSNKKSRSRKNTNINKNLNIPIKNTDIYNLITNRLKKRQTQDIIIPINDPLKQSPDPLINIKNDIEYVQNMLDEVKNKKTTSHNKTKKAFSYSVDNEIPWGNMKNGQKQCFREWKRTSSASDIQCNNSPLRQSVIQFSQQPVHQHLQHQPVHQPIQQPVQQPVQQLLQQPIHQPVHQPVHQLIQQTVQQEPIEPIIIKNPIPTPSTYIQTSSKIHNHNPYTSNRIQSELHKQNIPIKINKKIKKTIHNKYKLGKSNHSKNTRVGILLKNPSTRKNIIDECKKLKAEDISEIKSYLRKRGFIKEGSIAPSNVIRELYCSLKTTGDVQNMNKEYTIDDLQLGDKN